MVKKVISLLMCVCLCTSLFTTMILVSAAEQETVDSAYVIGDFPMDGYNFNVRQHNRGNAPDDDYAMNADWYKTADGRTYLERHGDNGFTRVFFDKSVSDGQFIVEFEAMSGIDGKVSFGLGSDWKVEDKATAQSQENTLLSGLGSAGKWEAYKVIISVAKNGNNANVTAEIYDENDNFLKYNSITTTGYSEIGHIYIFGGWGSHVYGVDNVKIYETNEKLFGYNDCDNNAGFLNYDRQNNMWYCDVIDESKEESRRKYFKATKAGYGSIYVILPVSITQNDCYFTAEFDYMGKGDLEFADYSQADITTEPVKLNASDTVWNRYRIDAVYNSDNTLTAVLYTNGSYTSTTKVKLNNTMHINSLLFGGWSNKALDNIRVYRTASRMAWNTIVENDNNSFYTQDGKTPEKDGWGIGLSNDGYMKTNNQYRLIYAAVDGNLTDVFSAEFKLKGLAYAEDGAAVKYAMPNLSFRTKGKEAGVADSAGIVINIPASEQQENVYRVDINTLTGKYDLYINGAETVKEEVYTVQPNPNNEPMSFKSIGFEKWAANWGVKDVKITNLLFASKGNSFILTDDTESEDAESAGKSIKSVAVSFDETALNNIRARAVSSDAEGEQLDVPVTVVFAGGKAIITPNTGVFADNTAYTVVIPAGYVNNQGVKGESIRVSFTTPNVAFDANASFTEKEFTKDGKATASFTWTKGTAAKSFDYVIAAYKENILVGVTFKTEMAAENVFSGSSDSELTLTDDADTLKLYVFENGLTPVLDTVPTATAAK